MNEFIEFLHEVFEQFGVIKCRKMFGGYGIFHEGIMFALVADDMLYLKVNDETKKQFEQKGLKAFKYSKNGKQFNMSYYLAPDEIFDDKEMASIWASSAYQVALHLKS